MKFFTFSKVPALALALFLAAPLFASAATISLSPASVTVHQGQEFSVGVVVNPGATTDYTVKLDAAFTPGIISLSTWMFTDVWTVLRQPGYDEFSNANGTLTRTGGYPGGFSSASKFGTATFVAQKVGSATISLTPNSFTFDDNSQNNFLGANTVHVTVLPPLPNATTTPVAIDHTFDIAVELSKSVLAPNEPITATVHLNNLSSKIENLQVPVHYAILNGNGDVVVADDGTINMSTANNDYSYSPNITNLPAGTYSFTAQVQYPNITAPAQSTEFFTIEVPPVQTNQDSLLIWILGALIVGLFIGAIIMRLFRRKRHEAALEAEPKTRRRK